MGTTPRQNSNYAPHGRAMRYVIGDLRLDIGRQRVTRGAAVIPLPRLSFNLLVALARAAPDLLSCGELLEQVWPKAVVNPETVNQRVRLVRAALGDDAYSPRYIEGLRGRGYRLIPPVHSESAESPDTDPRIEQPATAAVAADSAAVSAGAQDPANLSATVAAQKPLPFRATPAAALLLSGLIVTLIAVTASVWALRHEPLLSAATDVGIQAGQQLAIAVLPFQNLSPTADDGYIALGITDAVQQRLASVPQLIVVARSAPFARGVSSPSALEAGRLLAVRYIVEGSTQRKQNRLRVTAHLIDTQANREIWSLKLERRADALFEVQDEVADQISRQLTVILKSRDASGSHRMGLMGALPRRAAAPADGRNPVRRAPGLTSLGWRPGKRLACCFLVERAVASLANMQRRQIVITDRDHGIPDRVRTASSKLG